MPKASEIAASVEADCLEQLSGTNARTRERQLELGAIEILSFVAAKLVLPIVIAFAKDVLLDEFKRVRSRKDVERTHQALAQAELSPVPRRDLEAIRREAIVAGMEEGLSEETARRLADRAIASVQGRAAAA